MEEDASSMISCAKMNLAAETSDSNNTIYTLQASNKRMRVNDSNTSFAKFKGVVPQHNGHWGAQIYANHQRIWLGTFRSEKEAAMAYDSAAIKLRSGDSHRNFPWTEQTAQEPKFQTHYSSEAVLNMIRDGSYPSKFAAFLRTTQSQSNEIGISLKQTRIVHGDGQFSCSKLFLKELTPSDVGKLNRLVIPKKYAIRYFPYICESTHVEDNKDGDNCGAAVDDVELVFYDKQMKSWKFRYCYWRSSQSFVFTRGWNKFVKEKKLKANDIITFYTCESVGKAKDQGDQPFCLIDIIYNNGEGTKKCLVEEMDDHEVQLELELNLGKRNIVSYKNISDEEYKRSNKEEKVLMKSGSVVDITHNHVDKKGIRLFGVNIIGDNNII
ncbi:AP2/ERF and B3 domain-containing transcription factor At1g51120-like [Juglans microcarpa x Juglans regia]|uniref:AP2/ERF and B3 domain-containing transcription factor At1g51120-like n=1 Tax=Juglans microcarpa x Juglans regia TaxID=2249226 RepID=UPI001B7F116B|nr:AP2/ERF and B3 domain-containing transcription factor At1g51120-like [Juglans microcarpa x Juglans regia]